jgi:NDP-sugar pyrophosphorylase family protein
LSQPIALFVYLPLARFSLLLERLGFDVDSFPLSAYRNSSFYSMRTDALDRFGTKLEKRFTKTEIAEMMERAGLDNIVFSDSVYWCAVGYRK